MRILTFTSLLIAILSLACDRAPSGTDSGTANEVVLYTSVDEPYARAIIQKFEQQSGIKVLLKTDTEATKSVGLAARLEAEKANPQADVWWGNEVFHTINLADRGVLAAYASLAAEKIPPLYKDPQDRWAGTALRARVIARTLHEAGNAPTRSITSILDLAKPALKGKICMARPTAGTTGGHVSAIYTHLGPDNAEQFFRDLKANDVKLLGGNSVVAEYVGLGQLWAGLTDNDDVDSMLRENVKLDMVLPDQGEDQFGTLTIPCTVAMVAGAKHPDAAKQLIEYLLSPEVEKALLDAKFARYSVFASNGAVRLKAMPVSYADVAKNLKPAVEMAMRVLEGRDD
jgi:iron(III) transport system substrate-binding protein